MVHMENAESQDNFSLLAGISSTSNSRLDQQHRSRRPASSVQLHCMQPRIGYDFVDKRTSSFSGGNSAAALQLSSGSTIPFTAVLPAAALAAVQRRRHGRERGSPAAVEAVRPPPKLLRQSGSVLRELNCGRSFPAAPAGVLRELNCRRGWQVWRG
ncbi:unnamed protein product [Boreogadus saida]